MERTDGREEEECTADFSGAIQRFPCIYIDHICDYIWIFRRYGECDCNSGGHYDQCDSRNGADVKSRTVPAKPEETFGSGGESSA